MIAKVRRPRAEVAPVVAELDAWAADAGLTVEFGGSWRRQSPTVGDLDVIVVADTLDGIVLPPGFRLLKAGRLLAQGVYRDVQVDLWACPPANLGTFLWFVTGPRELNVAMRARARTLGWKLNQTGLAGYDGPVATEADVAAALKVPHLAPSERDDWAAHWATGTVTTIVGSSGATYQLVTDGGAVSCTCPGFRYRHACKHTADPAAWTPAHA